MKVKELIGLLEMLPQNHQVVIAKGNAFSPLSDYSLGRLDGREWAESGKKDAICLWPA